jgi:hypothetical protein
MKLQGYRETFYAYSGKVSDICRQLALAGIAIIWIFKRDIGGIYSVPKGLLLPMLLIACGLLADLAQYLIGSATWFAIYRLAEYRSVSEDTELRHASYLEIPIHIFFWAKAICLLAAYAFIARYFFRVVTFS